MPFEARLVRRETVQRMPNHESDGDARVAKQILASKMASRPEFDDSERVALGRFHRALADRQWSQTLRARNEELGHDMLLQLSGDDDEVLRRDVNLRRPPPRAVEEALPGTAHDATIGRLAAGCFGHVTPPPYTTGDPLVEEVGPNASVVPGQTKPAAPAGGLAANGVATFSQLALPTEGALSLGVALGKAPFLAGFTLYPPAHEYPQTFPVPGGLLEVTSARGNLGHYFACLPGAPLNAAMVADVTVDVTVGVEPRPFYLVRAPASGPPILQAFGVINVVVSGSGGETAQHEALFLEHREGASGPLGTPVVSRELAVSRRLNLRRGTTWVYVGVEARVEVQRFFILPPPPAGKREGFVSIDLRSRAPATNPVDHLLDRGGPLKVPRIAITLCPQQVFA
jgi:hypothetical protein